MALTKVTYSMIDGTTVNATDYGVSTANTAAANTTAFNSAFAAAAGKTLYIPAGTYNINTGLTASANTTIVGYGATIQNTSTAIQLLQITSGCSVFGLSFVGNSSTYNANGKGIYIAGVRNAAGVAPTFVSDITIKDCNFSNIAGYAIELLYAKNVIISNNNIYNIGYSGVFVYSGENVLVDSNTIDTLTGETSSGEFNAYGVTFTSLVNTTDFIRDPQSAQCRATNNLIKNIPTWNGLDTHGGTYCEFIDNEIIDCRRGVILTNLGTVGASNCTVQGNTYVNTLTGTNSNGTQKHGEAFWDIGASTLKPNYYNVIKGNTCNAGGDPVNISGAIWLENAEDGEVSDNFIINAYNCGVFANQNVNRYGIRRNTIVDVQSNGTATTNPACIIFYNTNWQSIDVSGNTFSRKNTILNTYVSLLGVYVANTSNKTIGFYKNNFNEVVTDFYIPETTGLSGEIKSTYTGTLTGLTTSPTVTVQYEVVGTTATISIPAQVTGTSNTDTLTITGSPTFLRPLTNQYNLTRVIDNGVGTLGGVIALSGSSAYSFYKNVTFDVFTSSGTKGVTQITFTYLLQ